MSGKLIVIDGGDGCGKTSLLKAVRGNFPSENFVFTREPGGTGSVTAEKIRELILDPTSKSADPDTLFHLFWASRIEHIKSVIWPALKVGKNVFTDRFDSSTYAYQIVGEQHFHLKSRSEELRREYIEPLHPGYLFLDVDPKEGRRRALLNRGVEQNHFDQREIEFYTRVGCGYYEFFTTFCSKGSAWLNANEPLEKVIHNGFENIHSILNR